MLDDFLIYQELRGYTPKTIKRRRWTLTTFTRLLAPRTLRDATLGDVESFIGARKTPATRRALLGDLKAFYRWGMRRQVVTHDPTVDVDSVRVPKRRPTPLTRAELNRALLAADERMTIILLLGAHAGLRVSEIGRLHTRDVDLETGWLMVRDGKGGKDDAVPLSPELVDVLTRVPDGPVIGMRGDSVSHAVRRHFKTLGIEHRPHDLRHTFGTEASRVSGGNLPLVASLMRHESIQTTQGYVLGDDRGHELVRRLYAAA